MNLKIEKIEAYFNEKETVMHYADIFKKTVAEVLSIMKKDGNISLYLVNSRKDKSYLTIKRNSRKIGKICFKNEGEGK